jgi:hypothetical protein
MQEAVPAPLAAWESFYVIVGSSAAALTGLQFVVITLVAEFRRGGTAEIAAFGTPTVVHFCAALLVSATLSAPWPSMSGAHLAMYALGIAGICYTGLVLIRARRQQGYKPVLEDWVWHTILPAIAYGALVAAAALMGGGVEHALFIVAATTLLLLFIGIHNAWDTVTYVAIDLPSREKRAKAADRAPSDPAPRPPGSGTGA